MLGSAQPLLEAASVIPRFVLSTSAQNSCLIRKAQAPPNTSTVINRGQQNETALLSGSFSRHSRYPINGKNTRMEIGLERNSTPPITPARNPNAMVLFVLPIDFAENRQ